MTHGCEFANLSRQVADLAAQTRALKVELAAMTSHAATLGVATLRLVQMLEQLGPGGTEARTVPPPSRRVATVR